MAERYDQATINYSVFEGSTRFLGTASADLPNISFLTTTLNGSGIGGNIEAVIRGMVDTMTLTLKFRNLQSEAASLITPERHTIELRVVMQVENPVSGELEELPAKHVFTVAPKTLNGGSIAPASTGDPSGEYAVRYWAYYVNSEEQFMIDPLNSICRINGTDWMESIRAELGI